MTIQIMPVTGVGEVEAGTDLAQALAGPLQRLGIVTGDVLVVTQKVVSKAEGAIRTAPTEEDYRRIVEEESARILRRRGDLVISVTRHGFVCANAGVDRSNVPWQGEARVVLLPEDPDRSARRLRIRLGRLLSVDLAVIISDTFGRAWRTGLVDVAIGVAGITPILDLRGSEDMNGRVLEVTEIAIADEIAAAAELAMGKAQGVPAALVRGLDLPAGEGRGRDLVRPPEGDLFR
jgi:coenzyme F420-0:L-glutamate ligase/coenzyme F420-1:gamma-L-glutamate ligase